jgi:hypothetical protein
LTNLGLVSFVPKGTESAYTRMYVALKLIKLAFLRLNADQDKKYVELEFKWFFIVFFGAIQSIN